jgi:ribonuclease R
MRKVLHGDRVMARIAGMDRRGRPKAKLPKSSNARRHATSAVCKIAMVCFSWWRKTSASARNSWCRPIKPATRKRGRSSLSILIEQPARHSQPVARVVEVLGDYGDPGMEIEIALRKHSLPHEFSDRGRKTCREICARGQCARLQRADSICAACRW